MEQQTSAYPTTYQRGWSCIFGKYQGAIFPTPTEAEYLVFQYQPHLRISAILPTKERQIIVEYPKDTGKTRLAKVNFPDLVMTQSLNLKFEYCYRNQGYAICYCRSCDISLKLHGLMCYCEKCRNAFVNRLTNLYNIYYLDRQTGIHYWSYGNVTDSGICFGSQRLAANLCQANANFWGSPFNNSNNIGVAHHRIGACQTTAHAYYNSQHEEFKKHRKQGCRRQIIHTCPCSCLNKDSHHPFLCKGCTCKCQCNCCLQKCSCVCNCLCCRRACNCGCQCDLHQGFLEFLVHKSQERGKPFGSPESAKNHIFGIAHLRSTQYCEGIFISYLENVIEKIDAPILTDAQGKRFIAGFARQIPDREWEVRFDTNIYLFSDKEVALIGGT